MPRSAAVTARHIIWFWPNVIGYVRLALVAAVLCAHSVSRHDLAAVAYIVCALLDGLDGFVARRFNQCTKFGEVLDVLIDIIQRATLWTLVGHAATYHLVAVVICFEWMTFASTHARSMVEQAHWKNLGADMPAWLRYLFSNNFRNPLGACAIGGTFFTPLYLYCRMNQLLPHPALYLPACLAAAWACKLTAMAAEAWLITDYLLCLAQRDAAKRRA